jgi:hypothetical protein
MHMTNRFKSALREAFPTVKFTVERNGQYVTWTDDGPTIKQVEDAIVKAGCVTEEIWNGNRYLYPNDDTRRLIGFDRYNVAEREAKKAESAHRRKEYEAQRARQDAAIRDAADKFNQRAGQTGEAFSPVPCLSPDQLAPLNAALERMRAQAEADVAARFETEEGDRRPSWAPPLIIEGELLDLCRELGYLAPEDKPICRLWGTFADPKRTGTWFREHDSRHALPGIHCRTFQLFAGPRRGNTSELLFEAQRQADGSWRTGPSLSSHMWFERNHERQCNDLIRERVQIEEQLGNPQFKNSEETNRKRQAAIAVKLAELEAADLEKHAKRKRRHTQRHHVVELARIRIFDFLGAAGVQMQAASRLCGQCCVCWRLLTDPISLERGIGPECWGVIVKGIKREYGHTGSVEATKETFFGLSPQLIENVVADYCSMEQAHVA